MPDRFSDGRDVEVDRSRQLSDYTSTSRISNTLTREIDSPVISRDRIIPDISTVRRSLPEREIDILTKSEVPITLSGNILPRNNPYQSFGFSTTPRPTNVPFQLGTTQTTQIKPVYVIGALVVMGAMYYVYRS